MGYVVPPLQKDKEEEEEEEEERVESGRSSASQHETLHVPKGISTGLDGGGLSRHPNEIGRKRPDLSDFGMGRHTHKRHVLRSRSSESHSHRRRSIPHRLRGEA